MRDRYTNQHLSPLNRDNICIELLILYADCSCPSITIIKPGISSSARVNRIPVPFGVVVCLGHGKINNDHSYMGASQDIVKYIKVDNLCILESPSLGHLSKYCMQIHKTTELHTHDSLATKILHNCLHIVPKIELHSLNGCANQLSLKLIGTQYFAHICIRSFRYHNLDNSSAEGHCPHISCPTGI